MPAKFALVCVLNCYFLNPAWGEEKSLICQGKSRSHVVLLEQIGTDIQASLENRSLTKYGKIGNAKDGSYEVAGKERSIAVVKNADLAHFRKTEKSARELMVLLLSGRQDAVGEEDLLYSHARTLVTSLQCD